MDCWDLFVDHQQSRMYWRDVEIDIDHKFDNNTHISSPISEKDIEKTQQMQRKCFTVALNVS